MHRDIVVINDNVLIIELSGSQDDVFTVVYGVVPQTDRFRRRSSF